MTGTRITNTRSVGVKITQADQNPVVVTASGAIVTDGNYAIYDATTTPGHITNHGFLDSKAASGTAVEEIGAKSTLTNDGTISGGSGVYMVGAHSTVTNLGAIIGQSASGDGIALANGGKITNGSQAAPQASIGGGNDGIFIEAAGCNLANWGIISGRAADGVKISNGNGTIANDGANSRISGALYGVLINANGHVSNQGMMTGQSGAGIYIGGVGTIANGDSTHTSGVISGGSYGVFAGGQGSEVSNDGTIIATTNSGDGIVLNQGGMVQNGSVDSPGGTIHGGLNGVLVHGLGATIANYGTMTGGDGIGVSIESSTGPETVINGSGTSGNFLIGGASYGVSLGGDGHVQNDGTISAISGAGVYIAGTGTVGNGDASDTGRTITGGRYGVYMGGASGITNFGSISGANSSGIGVKLKQGGTLQNGSATAKAASVIGGSDGVRVDSGDVTLTNFGTITGTHLIGIDIENNGGASSVNNEKGALTKGATGLSFGGTGTLTNAGTITGTGGNAVVFTGTADTLVVDPGAVFRGTVNGGSTANTLDLAAGTGTISSLGTKFSHFGTVTFESGAHWTLMGSNSAVDMLDNGSVKIATGASLDVTSAVSAGSTGLFQIGSGATLELAADAGGHDSISFLGASELVIDNASLFGTHVGTSAYAGPEVESFVAGDMIDLTNVAAAGAAFTYNAATGLLQITSANTAVATIFFEQSTLGSGKFHIGHDDSGHVVISHH